MFKHKFGHRTYGKISYQLDYGIIKRTYRINLSYIVCLKIT